MQQDQKSSFGDNCGLDFTPGNPLCESCRLYCAKKAGRRESAQFPLTGEEAAVLGELSRTGPLPVCRFILKSSVEDELENIALAPVLIRKPGDDVKTAVGRGKIILALEKRGLVLLDYETPLPGYNYDAVKASAAFAEFLNTVNEGKSRPGFLFDTADLDAGSMALTDDGAEAILDYLRE